MVRQRTIYDAVAALWTLAVVGALGAVYSGAAATVLTPSQVPVDPPVAFAAAGGTILLVWLVVGQLKKRAWIAMGRTVGLEPEGRSLFGAPTLSGTVDGRPVRVRTFSKSSGGQGSNSTRYTAFETDLRGSASEGAIIGRAGGTGGYDLGDLSIREDAVGDRFTAAAGSGDLAEDLLTPSVREPLLAVDTVGGVFVGDAGATVTDAVPDMGDSLVGGMFESKLESSVPGDPSTVTHRIRGVVRDAEDLRQHLRAVVAVADAFEAATAGGRA